MSARARERERERKAEEKEFKNGARRKEKGKKECEHSPRLRKEVKKFRF